MIARHTAYCPHCGVKRPGDAASDRALIGKLIIAGILAVVALSALIQLPRSEPTSVASMPDPPPAPSERAEHPAAAEAPIAQAAPSYAIEAYCEEVSQVVGGSYQIKAGCIEQERAARAATQSLQLPDRIRNFCDQVATTVGGSYQTYLGCLQQESEAMARIQ